MPRNFRIPEDHPDTPNQTRSEYLLPYIIFIQFAISFSHYTVYQIPSPLNMGGITNPQLDSPPEPQPLPPTNRPHPQPTLTNPASPCLVPPAPCLLSKRTAPLPSTTSNSSKGWRGTPKKPIHVVETTTTQTVPTRATLNAETAPSMYNLFPDRKNDINRELNSVLNQIITIYNSLAPSLWISSQWERLTVRAPSGRTSSLNPSQTPPTCKY